MGSELIRNVGIALVAIAIITLLMLGDIRAWLLLIATIVASLVNMVGFLHLWHVNVDIASAVFIIMALGVGVDYASHVALAFVTANGNSFYSLFFEKNPRNFQLFF